MPERLLKAQTNGGLKFTESGTSPNLEFLAEIDQANLQAASAFGGSDTVMIESGGVFKLLPASNFTSGSSGVRAMYAFDGLITASRYLGLGVGEPWDARQDTIIDAAGSVIGAAYSAALVDLNTGTAVLKVRKNGSSVWTIFTLSNATDPSGYIVQDLGALTIAAGDKLQAYLEITGDAEVTDPVVWITYTRAL